MNLSLRSFETGHLSADNSKKVFDLDGSTLEPAVRSGDTGQRIFCFDSFQLITKLMCNQFSIGLPNQLESVRVNIGFPVVRTDGRAYGHVITKFSRMGRLPHFLRYGAPLKFRQLFLRVPRGLVVKHSPDAPKGTNSNPGKTSLLFFSSFFSFSFRLVFILGTTGLLCFYIQLTIFD